MPAGSLLRSLASFRQSGRCPSSRLPIQRRSLPCILCSRDSRFLFPQSYSLSSASVSLGQGFSIWLLLLITGIFCSGASLRATDRSCRNAAGSLLDVIDTSDMSMYETPPGHIGNLTEDQEAKLLELWRLLLKIFAINAETAEAQGDNRSEKTDTPPRTESGSREKRKSRLSFLGLKISDNAGKKVDNNPRSDILTNPADLQLSDTDDKYGQIKEFQKALADQSPQEIRDTFWSMVKYDHPDALLLRFLRARKWDVKKALVMLISTLHWRAKEMHVDDDIMKGGEALALEQSRSSDPATRKAGEDFLTQFRLGKGFIHGADKMGRPMCLIRVRLHRSGDQSEKSMERFTVHLIETTRAMLIRPVETAVIIFDMTSFTLANMDYVPVRFIIKCFEANYPESLGAILIHKAPWVFTGIWKVIRSWLDPVVAMKVHFTHTVEDLEEFIPRSRILKELEGVEDYEYKYIEPQPNENDMMADISTRDDILARRQGLFKELQEATLFWTLAELKKDEEAIAALKVKREQLIQQTNQTYWEMDPYVRARSFYDRCGILCGDGKVLFYSQSPTHNNGISPEDEQTEINGKHE